MTDYDQGYRGHQYEGGTVLHIVGKGKVKKKLTQAERRWHCRRGAVEPKIRHIKYDNRMDRNYLKDKEGMELMQGLMEVVPT